MEQINNSESEDKSGRVYCRNSRCRSRLRVPQENDHKAFCCRGCWQQFYRRALYRLRSHNRAHGQQSSRLQAVPAPERASRLARQIPAFPWLEAAARGVLPERVEQTSRSAHFMRV